MMKNIDFFGQGSKYEGQKQNCLQFKNNKRRISKNIAKSKSSISDHSQTNKAISLKQKGSENQIFYPTHRTLQQPFECISPIQGQRMRTLESQNFKNIFRNTVATQQEYRCRKVRRQKTVAQGQGPFTQRTNFQLHTPKFQQSSNRNQRFHTLNSQRNNFFNSRQSNKFKSINSYQRISDKKYSLHTTPEKGNLRQLLNKSQKSANNFCLPEFQPYNNQSSNVLSGKEMFNHARIRSESYGSEKIDEQKSATFSALEMIEVNSDRGKNFYDFSKKRNLSQVTSTNSIKAAIEFYSSPKISQFQLGLCCNQDLFGKTYPARHIPTNLILSIKIINKRQVKNNLQNFISSLKIQSYLSRPQLIQIYSIFSELDKIYVIMQYHNPGALLFKMKTTAKSSERCLLACFYELCCGVNDLHLLEVGWRNFRIQNISFFHETCKLVNFCNVTHLHLQKGHNSCAFQYSSPEVLNGAKYSKQSEVWALGILFLEMLTGTTPFQNLSRRQIKDKILHSTIQPPGDLDQNISRILKKMLTKQPKQRPPLCHLLKELQRTIKYLQHFRS